MQSQVLFDARMPLVSASIGASRFWLYRASRLSRSPLLSLQLSVPLATANRLTLGARTRISLLRGLGNKRFLSDWELEFPFTEGVQDLAEAFAPNKPNMGAQQQELPAGEPSPIELATPEPAPTQQPQQKSVSTTLRQFQIPEFDRKQADLFQQNDEPIQLFPTQVKQPQIQDDSQFGEQIENAQTGLEVLEQDDQREQSQFNYADQFDNENQLDQQIESYFLKDDPSVGSGLDSEMGLLDNSIESDIRLSSHSSQPDAKQTQQQQEQQLEPVSIKQKSNQKKQKNKRFSEPRKELRSTQKEKLTAKKKLFAESQSLLDIAVSENYVTVAETDFTGDQSGNPAQEANLHYQFSDQNNIEIIDNTIPDLKELAISDQLQRSEFPEELKPSQSEPIFQHAEAVKLANQAPTDAMLINCVDQTAKPKTDQSQSSLEASTLTPTPPFKTSFVPPQGFSVGGQVLASRTVVKPIDASDIVPAMLTPGEFVVNATDAQKHLPLLHHINQGGHLEVSADQGSEANTPQMMEQSSQKKPLEVSALSNQKWSSNFRIYPQLLPTNQPLQSGAFAEPHIHQSDSFYKAPDLIFRSQQPSLPSSSPPNHSSVTLPTTWNSIEDLLQVTANEPHSRPVDDSKPSHHDSNPTLSNAPFHELATSETISNLSPSNTLQTNIETIREPGNKTQKPNDAKTLEAALEILAQEIYVRLQQCLTIERERQGIYSGRLPW